jgi:hypothetical protein
VNMLLNTVLDIFLIVLLVDLTSGFFHWLEDSYGRVELPVIGALITGPNNLHHQDPTAFTANSWVYSARVLLVVAGVIIAGAWALDMLTWQVLLFVAIGVNANEYHKWTHMPVVRKHPLVRYLQKLRVVQTPQHHARHHQGTRNSHYCVVTNLINPVVDTLGVWRGLENGIEWLFGVQTRGDEMTTRAATL